jgi:hypothetical protein
MLHAVCSHLCFENFSLLFLWFPCELLDIICIRKSIPFHSTSKLPSCLAKSAMSLPRVRTLRDAKARHSGELMFHHVVDFCEFYVSFYTARSTSNTPSLIISDLPNQSTSEPSSSQSRIVSSKKRKKQHLPLHPKPSKVPKPGFHIHEANEAASDGITESDIETAQYFTQPSHTERRQRSANAWQELMPSLIHPLMAALHSMAPDSPDGVLEVETFTCKYGCDIRRSTVKIISFGGI